MRIRMWEGFCALSLGAAMANALCVWIAGAAMAHAQDAVRTSWLGVWQAQLDGLPSLILTLAEDTGSLEGTLVLNGINTDVGGPHIAVHEVHVLVHLRQSGMTLSFAVKGDRGSNTVMRFTIEQTSDSTAKIHCLDCGADAPVVEITKLD